MVIDPEHVARSLALKARSGAPLEHATRQGADRGVYIKSTAALRRPRRAERALELLRFGNVRRRIYSALRRWERVR